MFDSEFYPTPFALAYDLWQPYLKNLGKYSAVLEPSAGKGDLLAPVRDSRINVYAFEKNAQLRELLADKARIVGHDFLRYYGGTMLFDLIVMNPPFSNGDEHLLHAWEILARGDIACILNAETVRNPCTQRRKRLADLIASNGSVEYRTDAFANAERRTGVEIAIVRLHKEERIPEIDYDVSDKATGSEYSPFTTLPALRGTDVEVANRLGGYIRSYYESRLAFTEYVKAKDKLGVYLSPFFCSTDEILKKAYGLDGKGNIERVNDFSESVRQRAWEKIIEEFAPQKYLTKRTYESLRRFFDVNGFLDLTQENFRLVVQWILDNAERLMNESCEEVFDRLTERTFENRKHLEGWKTNNMWVVADKVIIPCAVNVGYTGEPSMNGFMSVTHDFHRILCWIKGTDYKDRYNDAFGIPLQGKEFGKWYEADFCRVKFFKKGTMHLQFTDIDVLNEFNRRACASKKWLGKGDSK